MNHEPRHHEECVEPPDPSRGVLAAGHRRGTTLGGTTPSVSLAGAGVHTPDLPADVARYFGHGFDGGSDGFLPPARAAQVQGVTIEQFAELAEQGLLSTRQDGCPAACGRKFPPNFRVSVTP